MHREDDQQPEAIARWGWRFHHLGIPTDAVTPGETELTEFHMYVSGFESSPFGVQWMRFAPDSPVHDLVRTVPHLAFEVDDLDAALVGKSVLTPPNAPSPGVLVAMIVDDGCPIELIQFTGDGR
jgi:hypothetical protein